MPPVFPLCRGWGILGGLVSQMHKDFSQTTIQGFLSCRVVGAAAACPAKELAMDKTFGE